MISPDLLLTIRNNPEILVEIPNDQTLYKLCSVNNEMRALCEHVDLWEQRYRKYYSQFLDVKTQTDLSWKEAYQITSLIRHYQYLYLSVLNADGGLSRELEEFENLNYDNSYILDVNGNIDEDTDFVPLQKKIGEVLASLNMDPQYYGKFILGDYYATQYMVKFEPNEIISIWNTCIKTAAILGKTELVTELADFMKDLFSKYNY